MQFDCARCDELLLDFAYGELDEVTAAAFRRHSDSCARCSAALADVRVVRETFSMLSLEAPSPMVDARILEAADLRLSEIDEKKRAAQRHESRSIVAKLFDVFRVAALRPQYAMAMLLVLVVGIGLLVAPQMRVSDEAAPAVAPSVVATRGPEFAPLPAPAAAPTTVTADQSLSVSDGRDRLAQPVLPEPRTAEEQQNAESAGDVAHGNLSGARGRQSVDAAGAPAREPVLAERSARRERAPVTLAVPTPQAAPPSRMLTRGGGGAGGNRDFDDEDSGRLGYTQTPAEERPADGPRRAPAQVAAATEADRQRAEDRKSVV